MIEILRSVRDIDASDRQALEHIMGAHLQEDQQVIIMAYTPGVADSANRDAARARLQQTIADQAGQAERGGITEEEADAAVDQAMRHVRPRPD